MKSNICHYRSSRTPVITKALTGLTIRSNCNLDDGQLCCSGYDTPMLRDDTDTLNNILFREQSL